MVILTNFWVLSVDKFENVKLPRTSVLQKGHTLMVSSLGTYSEDMRKI